jgi:hypothetical protein
MKTENQYNTNKPNKKQKPSENIIYSFFFCCSSSTLKKSRILN